MKKTLASTLVVITILFGCASRQTVAPDPYPGSPWTNAEIQGGFQRAVPLFIAIFKSASARNPSMESGTVYVGFTISPSGAVAESHLVRSTLNDQKLIDDVVAAVRTLDFGAKDILVGYSVASYPVKYVATP